ncbi:beta-propeller domain-containing protein [Lysinibacillus cavernae]|uniref:beta-propeller domain-containing protein n=1 Tax=Lysinibacillus cavernae TaxID=2666135 RepID=UPI0012D96600|nr:beta-propeller domain-containing protein [Lysinibacillus cavernae]
MKSKWLAIMLIVILAIVPGIFTWTMNTDVIAKAASTSMATQSWQASFSVALKKNKVTGDYVYVTTEKGQKVPATIELLEDQKTLVVKKLAPGSYQLHVKKEAFAQGGLNIDSQVIHFTIIETLTAVKSEKELQQYFKRLLTTERYVTTEEESADSAKSESKATANNESTTNNQVEGVEEGDIVVVKDGFIYTAKDQSITVVNAKDPNDLKLATSIKLKESQYISKLALYDNLLIAIGDEYIEKAGTSMVTASFYDISNPNNPKHVRDVGQEGYLQDIRITKDTLYLIGNMHPNYWILQEEKPTDLKPKTFDSVAGTEFKSLPLEKISILPNTMDGTYSLITAVDLKNGAKTTAKTKGYLGGSSGLYMSENALYLTTPIYESNEAVQSKKRVMDMIWMPTAADTQIFKWDVDGTALNFAGSTEVKGTVLNQYSMDEYKGNFRIFTTEGNTWDEKSTSYNHLFILDEHLKALGSVKGMAPGEKIYSARFMGEKAYVVTFKQVDPLFVIDVANPKKPEVLGELKIPGFSNYLHPLDETHLIGIGYDTEQRYDAYTKRNFTVTTNMKMSLFDVSDFHKPKEQSTVRIGGKGSYSDVQYNPKALFRNKEYNYFGFPVVLYEAGKEDDIVYQGQGAQIYEVTADKGIVLKGNIINGNSSEPYENWEQVVQRVVYIDDALYTIARNEVKSYQLKDFKSLDTLTIK